MTPEKRHYLYPMNFVASEAMTAEEFLEVVKEAKAEYVEKGLEWSNSPGEQWERYWRRRKIGENAKKAQNG